MSANDRRDERRQLRREVADQQGQDEVGAQGQQEVEQQEEAAAEQEEAPPPAEVPAKEPWDWARYEQYILTRYSDYVDEREQIADIRTTAFAINRFLGTLWMIDDHETNGQAFMRTPGGPIEFRRGPMAWNPSNRDMLERLDRHITENQNEATRIGYTARGDNTFYKLSMPGFAHYEVDRSHPWHPDYGRWIREEFQEYMRRGEYFPVMDMAPQPGDDEETSGVMTSHVELQTVQAARRLFRAQRVRARSETTRTYAVNLQFTGNITEQQEQDDSSDGSLATQDEDTGNR